MSDIDEGQRFVLALSGFSTLFLALGRLDETMTP